MSELTELIIALLVLIRVVESADGLDPKAQGNDYQITRVCVADVNRIYGTRYRWPEDVRRRESAEDIARLYLTYYGMRYFADYGKLPTGDVLAKIYHAGYRGFKRGDGKHYAAKVRRAKGEAK